MSPPPAIVRTDPEAEILETWSRNAAPWTEAVRNRRIESRRLVTDAAVIAAVQAHSPRLVLDIGCGEGWLARSLSRHGIRVVGIDAVAELIERARTAGGGEFRVLSYGELAHGSLALAADVVVCNFSLLGGTSVDELLPVLARQLAPRGRLIVQTLHPLTAGAELPYCDGWRPGSWAGCDGPFTHPAPWYFRTLGGWLTLFERSGLRIIEIREPLHPATARPVSVIFIAVAARAPAV
jgi:2-polyprenyl-3-methyl-5-hydroxy-6-metoxy-1,4-benzoquinol methylase